MLIFIFYVAIPLSVVYISFFIDLLPYSQNNEKDMTQEFLSNVVDKVCKYLAECNNRESKVIDFHPPEGMIKVIDYKINQDGDNLNTLFEHVDKILTYVVKTG